MIAEALWGWAQAAPHLLLFPLVLVEGPLATVLAGSLVAAGAIALPSAALLTLVAELTSDSGLFLLGRLGRSGRGRRFLLRLGLTEPRALQLQARMERDLPGVLLGAKVVDVAAVPVVLTIGLSGVPYARFLGWNALITAPKAGVLLALGALFGAQVLPRLDAWTAVAVAAACAAGYLLLKRLLARAVPETPLPART